MLSSLAHMCAFGYIIKLLAKIYKRFIKINTISKIFCLLTFLHAQLLLPQKRFYYLKYGF